MLNENNNDFETQFSNSFDQTNIDNINNDIVNDNIQNNFEEDKNKVNTPNKRKTSYGVIVIALILTSIISGFAGGYIAINSKKTVGLHTATNTASNVNLTNQSNGLSIPNIVSNTENTVVEISVTSMSNNPFFGSTSSNSSGSGVIVNEDGYIVTNNHVVENASNITVTLKSGSKYEAKIIGTDPSTDLAVIKIEEKGLQPAVLGDSSNVVVGELAIAIGNPLGQLGGTVTEGIISALDREINVGNETMTVLQTSAAVNPGNSGGGLFNSQGQLIGIVNAKSSGNSSGTSIEGLGFAIPVNTVKEVVTQLIENGKVSGRPFIGLNVHDIQENNLYGTIFKKGVYVVSTVPNSPASKAGFLSGDRIVKFGDKQIDSYNDIKSVINSKKVGDVVKVEIIREGKTMTLDLTIGEK